MFDKLNVLIISVFVLAGCTESAPGIFTLCERDAIGNYIIKWETDPVLEGTVKIYASDNPESFSDTNPVIYANAKDGVATYITKDNITRIYFKLMFNDKFSEIVGSRVLKFDYAQNFRDLGGYASGDKKIRWGKVYRSGEFHPMKDKDSIRFHTLGIKTIIDLRDEKEAALHPMPANGARIVRIPISLQNKELIPELIQSGKMRKRDVLLYMQDQYLNFMDRYSEQYAEALSLFENPDNYPILFNCSIGKDRTGFLTALLLSALDIPEPTILSDYTLSTGNININSIDSLVLTLDTEGQEAFTVLLTSSEAELSPTLLKIEKEYGSMDNYLTKKMHLTAEKRKKIKDILLN